MKVLNKDEIIDFMEYYHYFHDSNILFFGYNVKEMKTELIINTFWSGKPSKRKDGTLETNGVTLKIKFDDVIKCDAKEIYPTDYIDNAYLKYIKYENQDVFCFADDEESPSVYIVCKEIKYKEI